MQGLVQELLTFRKMLELSEVTWNDVNVPQPKEGISGNHHLPNYKSKFLTNFGEYFTENMNQ